MWGMLKPGDLQAMMCRMISSGRCFMMLAGSQNGARVK
jgi:hypothetical protein